MTVGNCGKLVHNQTTQSRDLKHNSFAISVLSHYHKRFKSLFISIKRKTEGKRNPSTRQLVSMYTKCIHTSKIEKIHTAPKF